MQVLPGHPGRIPKAIICHPEKYRKSDMDIHQSRCRAGYGGARALHRVLLCTGPRPSRCWRVQRRKGLRPSVDTGKAGGSTGHQQLVRPAIDSVAPSSCSSSPRASPGPARLPSGRVPAPRCVDDLALLSTKASSEVGRRSLGLPLRWPAVSASQGRLAGVCSTRACKAVFACTFASKLLASTQVLPYVDGLFRGPHSKLLSTLTADHP